MHRSLKAGLVAAIVCVGSWAVIAAFADEQSPEKLASHGLAARGPVKAAGETDSFPGLSRVNVYQPGVKSGLPVPSDRKPAPPTGPTAKISDSGAKKQAGATAGSDTKDGVRGDIVYQLDDGVSENGIGLTAGGSVAWMNHFVTVAGAETISTISISYDTVANGTLVTAYLWSDPNQDGNPTDGQVLASAATAVAGAGTDTFVAVDMPDTAVGPAGTHFFVGAIIQHAAGEFPCSIDQTASQGQSWIAGSTGAPVNPNNMGSAELPPSVIDDLGLPGNWLVRAEGNTGGPPDCNGNGTPDDQDIAGGTSADCNANGTPDECEFVDCNGNGTLDACDIAANPSLDVSGGGANCTQPDGVPDSCQDCNNNGSSDGCELNANTDCDDDGTLDECQPTEDCNSNGTFDACELTGGTQDYNITGGLPIPIPDLATTTHTFTVPQGGTIEDVDVDLTATHTWVSDLAISVTHDGTTVLLFNHQCGSEDNFNGTIWDDEASGPIACVTGHAGTFQPFGSLSDFDGADAAGDWTITIQDTVGGDSGTLMSWSLHIATASPGDCNGNGTPDECELAGNDCDGNGTIDGCELEGNDCNENGVPDQCDLAGGLATYDHAIPVSPPLPVNNTLPPAVHNFTVVETGPISDVDVGITMTHTWVNDVVIKVGHLGTEVLLFNHGCGSENDFLGTLWDDEAAGPIVCTAGHVGTFKPFAPLTAFDGMEASGVWTMTVTDTVGGDNGSLTAWRLRLSVPGTNDCDGNGTPDECDPDCNGNGRPDGCDIQDGTSEDCQPDGIPDECQIGRDVRGGDVVISQLPNAVNGIFSDTDCGLCGSGQQVLAENFTLSADATIAVIHMWGGYFPGNNAGAGDNFTVIFHEVDAGLPGTVISTETAVPSTRTQTGIVLFGVDEWEFLINLANPVSLTAGTYFVEVFNNTSGNADSFFWETGNLDGSAGIAGQAFAFEAPGATWTYDGTTDMAYELITGTGGGGGGDCNSNGIPDDCDIADGTAQDCNSNGLPDSCEFEDCDGNGTFDECDILNDPSVDQGGGEGPADCDEPDGIPDVCQDCNGNGTVDCADLLPGTSNIKDEFADPNLPIPDCNDTGASSSINFTQCGTIEDLDVQVQINHSWVGDLVVELTHGTTTVVLMSRPGLAEIDPHCSAGECCGNSSDNVNVIFDDAAGASIEGAATLSGTFQPDPGNLSDFNGQDKCGTWTLRAYDGAAADTGTLVHWGLIFRNGGTVPPYSQDCNGTGIPDECELSSPGGTFEHTIPVSPAQPISNTLPPATNTFSVPEGGSILDVDFGVTLTHTWASDLEIRVSHGATTVLVFDNQCGSEDNFNGTVWDDEAAGTISCTTGHSGTFQPLNPLSAFDGADASGPWTVSVTDNVGGDSGSLTGWFLRLSVAGESNDCDNNGVPDECDPDCNENGNPDACDITGGTSGDCNGNIVPDECEPDCNANGNADDCDIASGTSDDCNKDGTPDECTGSSGGPKSYDVEANLPIDDVSTQSHTFTVPESGTITDLDVRIDLSHTWIGDLIINVEHNGASVDLWRNQCGNTDNMLVIFDDEGLPDALCTDIPAAELRLKTAGELFDAGPGLSVFDGMDKAGEWTVTITDTVGGDFGTLHTYRLDFVNEGTGGIGLIDCNSNGLLDECDILFGLSTDCNHNGTPDDCEYADCNNNGTNDLCDIDSGNSEDLNLDEIPDECQDCNGNGIPDFFDVEPSNIKYYAKNFNPPPPIPDCNDAGVVSTVNVEQFGLPTDVDVALAIDHTNNGDLYVTLSHNGVTVTLLSRPGLAETNPLCAGGATGGSDDDGLDIVLSDEALTSAENADSGGGVLLGTFRPSSALSAFDTLNKHGDWTLTVRDGASSNTGTLVRWQLRLANNQPFSDDCNQNGTPDECESGGADCNGNGTFDACELEGNDCNEDGTPDDCQLDPDCNNNGTPDNCDLADDCNGNGIPDACELTDNDCNNNGTPDECDLGGESGTVVYNIPVVPPQPIPDANPTGTSHTFNVPVGGTIQDVDVDLTATHTWVADLNITVTHGATTVTLFGNQCGSEDNFTNTVWDDEASGPIACVAGHTGSFTPFSPLSAFDGMDAAGAWTIMLVDSVGADVGALSNWSLHLTTGTASNDCDDDGVPDECEEDCNNNGTPDDCELGGSLENNYAIPVSPPAPITDFATTTRTYNVPDSGTILDVDVDVSLTHTWIGDLEISVAHLGTTVVIFDNQCGNVDNMSGTVFDDEAAGPISCVAGNVGTFRPFSPLTAFDGLEAAGDWTISISDSAGGDTGALSAWSLSIEVPNTSGDCNGNGIPDECEDDCNNNGTPDDCDIAGGVSEDCQPNGTPDECDIAGGGSMDANGNGTPDECEGGAPAATIVSVVSRKVHQPPPPLTFCDLPINLAGQVENGDVTTEPRIGGITELRITFDVAPGPATPYPVAMYQQTGCPPGSQAAYVPYSGVSLRGASLEGNTLVLTFQPGLENPRTYQFEMLPHVTTVPNQFVEVRRLYADVTDDGRVNAADRSAVVGIWTGPGFSCKTDVSVDNVTNAADRSAVVGAWTGGPSFNCAP